MGVGMVENDTFVIIHKNIFHSAVRSGKVMDPRLLPSLHHERLNDLISFGLNLSVEDYLPVIHGARNHAHPTPESAVACRAQLTCIENVLFQAFNMTIQTFTTEPPQHLPDFSRIINKLKHNVYEHADECMSDVYEVLSRYENSALILMRSGKAGEGDRRLSLKKDLAKTLKEFQQAIQSYNGEHKAEMCIDDFWGNDQFRSAR